VINHGAQEPIAKNQLGRYLIIGIIPYSDYMHCTVCTMQLLSSALQNMAAVPQDAQRLPLLSAFLRLLADGLDAMVT
jgi:hypothetical protein